MANPGPHNIHNKAQSSLNQQKAFDLHLAGATYRQIAESLEVSVSTAHRYIRSALDELAALRDEKAERARELADQRLDDALRRVRGSEKYREGDPAAINTYVKLEESRRKLWGIDMPQRVDVTAKHELAGPFFDDEVDDGTPPALPAEE